MDKPTCQSYHSLSRSLEEHLLFSSILDKDSWPCDRGEGHRALELGLHWKTHVGQQTPLRVQPFNDSLEGANSRAAMSGDLHKL